MLFPNCTFHIYSNFLSTSYNIHFEICQFAIESFRIIFVCVCCTLFCRCRSVFFLFGERKLNSTFLVCRFGKRQVLRSIQNIEAVRYFNNGQIQSIRHTHTYNHRWIHSHWPQNMKLNEFFSCLSTPAG